MCFSTKFVFKDLGDSYSISKIKLRGSKLIIPANHNGKPVSKIEVAALQYKDQLKVKHLIIEGNTNGLYELASDNLELAELPNLENIPFANSKVKCKYLIGSKAKTFDVSLFRNCPLLKVEISNDNPNFKTALDGKAIVSKDGKILYAIADCYQIPEGVEELSRNVFRWSILPDNFVIPSTVKVIGDYCFYNVKSKTVIDNEELRKNEKDFFKWCQLPTINRVSIILPKTVEHIGEHAFSNNTDIAYVFYELEKGSDNWDEDNSRMIKLYKKGWDYYQGYPLLKESINEINSVVPITEDTKDCLRHVLERIKTGDINIQKYGSTFQEYAFDVVVGNYENTNFWNFEERARAFLDYEDSSFEIKCISLLAVSMKCALEGSLALAFDYITTALSLAGTTDSYRDTYRHIISASYCILRKKDIESYAWFYGTRPFHSIESKVFPYVLDSNRYEQIYKDAEYVVKNFESTFKETLHF